jgi:DNA-binding response OmpR family regulator
MDEVMQLLRRLVRGESTVLVVDDQACSQDASKRFLCRLGLRVISARSLTAASRVLGSVEVDLVLLRCDAELVRSYAQVLRACDHGPPILALAAGSDAVQPILDALACCLAHAPSPPSPN